MKTLITLLITMISLTGCIRMTCMSPSCLGEETYNNLMHPKPYGAHWIKEGMTRESRRVDLIVCGSPNGEEIEFSRDQIIREKNPSEPNSAAAYLRLRDKVGACMQSKGYTPVGDLQFLGGCDARCLYP
jgi:hypothetical protein